MVIFLQLKKQNKSNNKCIISQYNMERIAMIRYNNRKKKIIKCATNIN